MRAKLPEFFRRCGEVLLGKDAEIKLAMTCLLARGHLLIEDIPGVGKTTLVQLLAHCLGLTHARIQFTSDLLPADILGSAIYDARVSAFRVHRGAIFAQFILADELNRTSPKTQSALLQAMEEGAVTIENETFPLPRPFCVFATQNPHEQAGTFPLPESQIDRFLMRITLGYPERAAERRLLSLDDRRLAIATLTPVYSPEEVLAMQDEAGGLTVSAPILDYVQDVLSLSRKRAGDGIGLSPRAGLALVAASRVWAWLQGRDMVLPEDVQAVGVSVMAHRLRRGEAGMVAADTASRELLQSVRVF